MGSLGLLSKKKYTVTDCTSEAKVHENVVTIAVFECHPFKCFGYLTWLSVFHISAVISIMF